MVAILTGTVVLSSLLSLGHFKEFCRIGLELAFIIVCTAGLLKTELRMSLFLGVFYETGVFFWRFLLGAWMGVLSHSPAYMNFGTASGQVPVWLLNGLLAVLALYLYRLPSSPRDKIPKLFSIVIIPGFLAVISLSEQSSLAIPEDTLDMWTILAVILMMSVLIFQINRQYQSERELARYKSEQAKLLERNYTALNQAYTAHAKLFHDFHNHIGVLRRLLSCKKWDEACQYLDELQAPIYEMADTRWTGEETADYLINSKAAAARKEHISFQAQVEYPRRAVIRSVDLCAILGNLLDNALEAAGQVSNPEQRFITLTIRRIHQMLIIKVENSCQSPPQKKDGLLKSTKAPGGLHGWGLRSAQAAAEKYDGVIQTSYSDHIFRAVTTLSYDTISLK